LGSYNSTIMTILSSSTWIIQFIVNIIAAVLISNDLKKYGFKNNLIVLMTLFFSLIGITMFFIIANKEFRKTTC